MKTKILIVLSYILLCFISVTFAWMTNGDNDPASALILSWNDNDDDDVLQVNGTDISFELYYMDDDGEFYPTDSLTEADIFDDFVPNVPIYFQLRFRNNCEDSVRTKVMLTGITTTNIDIFDVLFFGTTYIEGYPEFYASTPSQVYRCLNENMVQDGLTYNVTLFESLYIAPLDADEEIVITAYIMLSRLAEIEQYGGITFDIGKFRVVM